MLGFIMVLIIIVCLLLALVILIQNPKGGGLNSTFGGVGNQILGAKRSGDFIENATWTLAVLLIVGSLLSAAFIEPKQQVEEVQKSEIEQMEDVYPVGPINPEDVNGGGQ